MDTELWNRILQFDFDSPISEYGFSTRLANENYWTKDFTQQAILEYRKFMYLAATSDLMVSPSEIIDVVWHQHLIFTQSYQDFCNLIGKQVQHIPSTHNKEEFEKFKQAKARTKKLYSSNFGEQPVTIWNYAGMYESLLLGKARLKIRTFIIIGILAFLILTIPFHFLLKPVYLEIDNPYFIIGFIALTIVSLLGLEIFNRRRLQHIVNQFEKNSFIYFLQPFELVYLKTQKLPFVINGVVNELIDKKAISVNHDKTINMSGTGHTGSIEELQAMNVLNSLGRTYYPGLLKQLATKPVFWNTANCMNAFKKYFNKSKKFGSLFYLNFGILSILLLIGFTRFSTGIVRDKPVMLIFMAILFLTLIIIAYLDRLTKLVCIVTIPQLYKKDILPTRQIEENWQWSYFLLGTAALSSSFVPLANYTRKHDTDSGSYGTSCGSSCGSSCSSCGGCGGD